MCLSCISLQSPSIRLRKYIVKALRTPTNRKPFASVPYLSYALPQIQSPLLVLRCRSARRCARLVWLLTGVGHSKATYQQSATIIYGHYSLFVTLAFSTAQTLACSLILSPFDYSNACSARAVGRRSTTACKELRSACCNIVKPLLVIALAASSAATCLQSSTYYILNGNHIDSIIRQWSASREHLQDQLAVYLHIHCSPILTSHLIWPGDLSLVMYSLVCCRQFSSQH